ncbi:hypothetical protein QZH41_005196 [Actinostola sp. cb2023]|nr:hypothetical protein QZH41_005196 [Actinostola sp. cb2023]
MADLPADRLEPSPPFTYCGVDYFGPWYVKQGRKELKRYGVLFTCMSSRAIHLEVAHSLETDSYINALRRFICRRGPVRQLRSDQGTNFIGARRELTEALLEMDQAKVTSEMLKLNCDWVEVKFNVPAASHMGGVWERQIRTVRSVLSALLEKNGKQLNDEALTTFMCEAEAVVNSRPLTTDNLNSADSLEPLTPNHLLTMKTKVLLPPPGVFQAADQYSRKQWRRVQHLSNEFWDRWRKEFLHSLQQRPKWTRPRRNLQLGDVVIMKEQDTPRNTWKLARVIEAYEDEDGLVRKVKLAVGNPQLTQDGYFWNPTSTQQQRRHHDRRTGNDHNTNLRMLLQRIQDHNLTLRRENNFSSRRESLRRLTRDKAQFNWTTEQQAAFEDLKSAITSAPVLIPFYPERETLIICDGSPTGLGGGLFQKTQHGYQPVHYVSRTLTDTESRYSQIEREALSVEFTTSRLQMYLLGGKHFKIATDHKPLLPLFNNPQAKLPPRIERMRQERTERIAAATETDEELQHWKHAMQSGVWDKKDPVLKPYLDIQAEIYETENVILRLDKIIPPLELQEKIVRIAHNQGHLQNVGLSKTKEMIRHKYWWPVIAKARVEPINSFCPCPEPRTHVTFPTDYNNFTPSNRGMSANHGNVQLKKIALPVFTGHRKDWPEFKAVWKQLAEGAYENKTALAHELKRSVKGEAAQRIKSVYVTKPEAYDTMWKKLETHYEDASASVQAALEELHRLKPVSEEDYKGLVELVDAVESSYSQLEELNQLNTHYEGR